MTVTLVASCKTVSSLNIFLLLLGFFKSPDCTSFSCIQFFHSHQLWAPKTVTQVAASTLNAALIMLAGTLLRQRSFKRFCLGWYLQMNLLNKGLLPSKVWVMFSSPEAYIFSVCV